MRRLFSGTLLIALVISSLAFLSSALAQSSTLTWTTNVVDQSVNAESPSLAFDSIGNPHISYHDSTNGNLKYAKWNGYAWSIQTVDGAKDVGQYCSLALGSDDKPQITYLDSSNYNLKYARWTGTTWTISTIDSTGTQGGAYFEEGSLVVDFQNKPHISYCSNDSLKYATWTGSSWDIQTVDSLTSGSSYFGCCSLALDSKGHPPHKQLQWF